MNDEKKFYMLMYGGWIVSILLLWYMFSRASVPHNQDGTQHIEQQLSTATDHQQSAQSDIERAERYAQASEIRLGRVADGTERLQEGVDESTTLISECQQILRRVQARGSREEKTD